jgi:hypothetical protein
MFMVRYFGPPRFRRHCVQRRDGLFWDGEGWVESLAEAAVYRLVGEAQAECNRLQRALTEGKPRREFRCSFRVTVIADDVAGVTAGDVAAYLRRAMNVSLDYEAGGDGPVAGGYVECGVRVAELEEVTPRKQGR